MTVQEYNALNVFTRKLTFIFTETKILMSFPNTWRVWLTCISSLETSMFSSFLVLFIISLNTYSSCYYLHFNTFFFFFILFHSKLKTKMYLALQSLELDLTKMMHMFRHIDFLICQEKCFLISYTSKKSTMDIFWC